MSGVLQKEKPELKEGDSHWLGSLGNHPAAWSQLRIYSEHLLDPAAKSTAFCTPLSMFTFLMRQHGTSFLKENKVTPPSKEKAKHCLYPTSSKKRKRTILLETNLHLLKPWAGVGWVGGWVWSKQCLKSPWIKGVQVFRVNVGHIPGVGPWRGSDPDWGTL